jgi:hypothetical protein
MATQQGLGELVAQIQAAVGVQWRFLSALLLLAVLELLF